MVGFLLQILNPIYICKKAVLNEKHVEKNETNSMKTEIAVISAIIGTLILGKGIWQFVYPETPDQIRQIRQQQRQNQTIIQPAALTREQLQRHTRIQQYLQEQRLRQLQAQLRRDQERRLTERLRRLHSTTRRT